MYNRRLLHWTFLFSSWFCPSIPTGFYGTGLAGYVGFQQNRNIKGELAQALVFVFLKGTTAPTGFLGWRDERRRVWGVLPHLILLSFSSISRFHSLCLCITLSISEA